MTYTTRGYTPELAIYLQLYNIYLMHDNLDGYALFRIMQIDGSSNIANDIIEDFKKKGFLMIGTMTSQQGRKYDKVVFSPEGAEYLKSRIDLEKL